MIKLDFSDNTSFRQIRLSGILIAFAFLYCLISIVLQQSSIVRDWEDRFQSRFYLLRSYFSQPEAADVPLVLVLIDDHSLPLGTPRSPVDRNWLADLISELSGHKPALIGMNILLDRAGEQKADDKLKRAIQQAGNVVLRNDPFYQTYPSFTKAALDTGTVRFKLDSSDTVQGVCATRLTCQSDELFYLKLLEYFHFINGTQGNITIPDVPWLKINFSTIRQENDGKKILSFPVIRAHEVNQVPTLAFKDSIILVGTGFPDLYPLYRVPISTPETMLQETELIAQVVNMVAGKRYFYSVPAVGIAIVLFVIMVVITLLAMHKGSLHALVGSVLFILLSFFVSGWAFAFKDIEIPSVLPAVLIGTFTAVILLVNGLREKFFMMETQLQLKQAKIDYLTNELHSHHLFNEFSRLSVMIGHDPKAAKAYLVEFAEMLRSSLKHSDQSRVMIAAQLEYLESYLNQQRLIHKGRLKFELSYDETLKNATAPWHVFFPLVENAVKYSEGYLKQIQADSAHIEISLSRQEQQIVFNVRNPFRKGATVSSSKTGLKNLRERLTWAYPRGGYQLNVKSDEKNWIAELRLPM